MRPLAQPGARHQHRLVGARGGACGGATEPLADRLAPLLGDAEIEALARRCERLLARGTMPAPDSDGPAIPWPPF